MKHKEGARRVVSVFAAFLLATMGLTAAATAGSLRAAANETDPDKMAVEDVLVEDGADADVAAEDDAIEGAAVDDAVVENVADEGVSVDDALAPEGSAAATPADPEATEEGAAAADESYVIWVRYGDTTGGVSDFGFDAQLGISMYGNLDGQDGLPSEGDVWMFGDGSYHRFLYWSFGGDMNKPLEASDFAASEQGGPATLEIYATWEDVPKTSLIGAAQACDIPVNGYLSSDSIDAWAKLAASFDSGYGYGLSASEVELSDVQAATVDDYLYSLGAERVAALDVSVLEHLNSAVEGYIDTASHDFTATDGVTMDLEILGVTDIVGATDLNDVWVYYLPVDGGEPVWMDSSTSGSSLLIKNVSASGTFVIGKMKDVPNPWGEDGGLLPYTVKDGVMTFDGRPDLGEWYQLTVEAADGITYDVPGGGAAWTMTIDASYLDADDPLYAPEINSGIYFIRGDGQGMSSNFWVDYDPAKALSYGFASGTGTIGRAGGPNTLSINLSSPAVLSLGYSTETVIANEQGATLTHATSGKTETDEWGNVWGDDATWSMLTLVTDPISGEIAEKAEAALKDAVDGVSNVYLLDIHLLDPSGNVFEIPEGDQVTVTLPIPASLSVENLRVFHIADDGTITDMDATVDATVRTVTFTTTHFSTFALANVPADYAGIQAAGDKVQPLDTEDEPGDGLVKTGDVMGVAGIAAVAAVACAAGAVAIARKRMQR